MSAMRVWAGFMIVVGVLFIGLGVLLGGIALFTEDWRQGAFSPQGAFERAIVVSGLVVSGLLLGSPFIVFGQLLQIFLDQRALLRRLVRRRRQRQPTPPGDSYPRLR